MRFSSKEFFYDTLRSPVLTEKSNAILEKSNSYVFIVDINSTKERVSRAVANVYNVKVESVNLLIVKGKKKLFRGKMGQRADYKKAIVRLAADCKIDFSTGV